MNFQDLKNKIATSSEPQGSFDGAAHTHKDIVQIIKEETFTPEQVVRSIRRSTNHKVTDNIVEEYRRVASSKEFTTDPVVLNLLGESKYSIKNKYMFVLENTVVAVSKETLDTIRNTNTEIKTIEDLIEFIER